MLVSSLLAFDHVVLVLDRLRGFVGGWLLFWGLLLFFGALLLVLAGFLFWRGAGQWPVILWGLDTFLIIF